jgi:DNA-binding LacI/PurR family transcriptional regulator
MTTLRDIAKLANVGKSTVSRVINNDPRVSEETSRRVKEVIEKYKYKPNFMARDLKKRDMKNLAIVIPNKKISAYLSHELNAQKIEGIASEALLEDCRLSIIPEQINDPGKFRQAIFKNDIDGVFILTEVDDESIFDFFTEYSIQVMLVNWPARSRNLPFVMSDHDKAAETALNYMAQKACKRIALMNCLRPFSLDKFEKNSKKAGLTFNKKWFWTFPPRTDAATIEKFMEQYKTAPPNERPDCIYISNDYMASEFIEAAIKNNISIPHDIKVTAFDDMQIASLTKPPLTCLRQDGEQQGKLALRGMLDLLNGKIKNMAKTLPVKLIKRESA